MDYLNPAAFTTPGTGTFGNVGKGALRGPNLITYDGGLFKDIPLKKERVRIQFRAEFFNLLNHPHFFLPGIAGTGEQDVNSPSSFGVISATVNQTVNDARSIQFALKLNF